MDKLLAREAFKAAVFGRDRNRCVLCGMPPEDAHHILERKLWSDGGYYLDNGASVCSDCHIKCEMTLVTPEHLRQVCGIAKVLLPQWMDPAKTYDKWGNEVLADRRRLPGPLFADDGCQKILTRGCVLYMFL